MRPVHVLVTADPVDEQAYVAAVGAAVDVYRFSTNLEASERLGRAQSQVAAVIVTQNQDPLLNLLPAQLVQLVHASGNPNLAEAIFVVVGDPAVFSERVYGVTSLHAALRLLMYGELEPGSAASMRAIARHAEQPAQPQYEEQARNQHARTEPAMHALQHEQQAAAVPAAEEPDHSEAGDGGLLLDSVISSIWDLRKPKAERKARRAGRTRSGANSVDGGSDDAAQRVQVGRAMRKNVEGEVRLFTHPSAQQTAPTDSPQVMPSNGAAGTPAHMPPMPYQLAPTEPQPDFGGLQPAVGMTLPSRGVYRGPRNVESASALDSSYGVNLEPATTHTHGPQIGASGPVVASQVQELVYPQANMSDPLLGFSAEIQRQLAAQPVTPAPVMQQSAAPAMQQPNASALTVPNGAAPQEQVSRRGWFGRGRDVSSSTPVAPQQAFAPAQPAFATAGAPAHTAPAAAGSGVFETPASLLNRADSAGDVTFG